ncbi:phosphoribosylanthranilate isomerase [Prevotella sp. OH937_COT-195]|uniref:phosphoribosylanthranilate isomerase n=1 Tax=Prevotella sp. OH937_COT-195 TaxID=2491051 RepID=UPI0018F6D351|nr:phosphoribosylanthranilate isomerase [Prevotella sp. OH937_COT-195]
MNNMLVKVCGMCEKENIRAVTDLDVDMIGFAFYPTSSRYVKMISAGAGIIPDYSEERLKELKTKGEMKLVHNKIVKRAGVFIDEMPQTIVSRIYNHYLDYVQLNGNESSIMIDNLKRSVDPDIHKGLKVIKRIEVREKKDLEKCREYEGYADLLLFDMKYENKETDRLIHYLDILKEYEGNIPFLLSCEFNIEDAEIIKNFNNNMFAGIDVNECFEKETGIKDVEKLGNFIGKIKN